MGTTATIVGSGRYTYEVHEDWAKLPDGWTMPAAAVTVDSQDRVYCSCHSLWGDSRGDLYVVRPGTSSRPRRVVKHVRLR